MGGQVQMMIDVMPNVYPHAKDGSAGSRYRRRRAFPARRRLPTISESACPASRSRRGTASSCRPARRRRSSTSSTPRSARRSTTRNWSRRCKSRGAQPVAGTPQDFAQLHRREYQEVGRRREGVGRPHRLNPQQPRHHADRMKTKALPPIPAWTPCRRLHRHHLREGRGHREDHDQPAGGAQRLPAPDRGGDAARVRRRARRRRRSASSS